MTLWDSPMRGTLEESALVLITASLGYEPKSARGFIAGYLCGKDAEKLTPMDIADAFHDWWYNLNEGTHRWYRQQAVDTLDDLERM